MMAFAKGDLLSGLKHKILNVRTELLYPTSIPIRNDRPFVNFCMTLTKLMVVKKLRHEKSVMYSMSSPSEVGGAGCLRGALSIASSGRLDRAFGAKCRKQ